MTVVAVKKDPAALTLTITSEFDVPVERLWQVWADRSQFEKWWGPPTHPATIVDHELSPGGRVTYYLSAPDGEKYHGWWRVVSIDPPHRFEFEDGFADETGEPTDEIPTTVTEVTLTSTTPNRTTMTMVSRFPSTEAMEQILAMGAEEGMKLALGQIDSLLNEETDT